MREDQPFKLRGGHSEQVAVFNRIAAIKRIKYLSGIDLSQKDSTFLYYLDLEMYARWYKKYPADHRIDEEWCQRAAEVAKELDKDENDIKKAMVDINKRIQTNFFQYRKKEREEQKCQPQNLKTSPIKSMSFWKRAIMRLLPLSSRKSEEKGKSTAT